MRDKLVALIDETFSSFGPSRQRTDAVGINSQKGRWKTNSRSSLWPNLAAENPRR